MYSFSNSMLFSGDLILRFACGRIRQEEPRPMLEAHPRIDLEQQPEPQSNCPRETVPVSYIPTMTMMFQRDAVHSTDDAHMSSYICSICLAEYQEKEILRIMPKCGHDFHRSCIDIWLRKHPTCPVCRSPLQDLLEQKHGRLASSRMSVTENVEPASSRFQQ